MATAKQGDTVQIHYTGRLEDGTVFDSSQDREPLSFTLGEGKVIPGFENAVEGMETGEKKTTTIPSEEAYGPRREELLMNVPREQVPDGIDPEPGQRLRMQSGDGRTFDVTVAEATGEQLVLDANHPLAGEDLTFDIELVEVG